MKRTSWGLQILLLFVGMLSSSAQEATDIWKEFRSKFPYGYQAISQKHLASGGTLTIISEPPSYINQGEIAEFVHSYGGQLSVNQQPFGYDGWLKDVVVELPPLAADSVNLFKKKLSQLIFGTDYKSFTLDFDHPSQFSQYLPNNINISITAEELGSWLLKSSLNFNKINGSGNGVLSNLLRETDSHEGGSLFESEDNRFVIWRISNSSFSPESKEFRINARIFSIDSDLILGAIGEPDKTFAIIGRRRQISLDEFPPLRTETIEILAKEHTSSLSQSYERYNVFAGKNADGNDYAPIYLSEELWHTEYGNLLNVTDQMLKSWSENGSIDYVNFPYEKPYYWAFEKSALQDIGTNELTFNWNTAGAAYTIEEDPYTILAVNRTGSLPVSYIPAGMEGQTNDEILDAEELGYDFFSNLNNRELARVVQYTTLYQIFQFYLTANDSDVKMSKEDAFSYFSNLAKGPFKNEYTYNSIVNGFLNPPTRNFSIEKSRQSKTNNNDLINYIRNNKNGEIGDSQALLKEFEAHSKKQQKENSNKYEFTWESEGNYDISNNKRYEKAESVISNLLRLVSDTTSTAYKDAYLKGLSRYVDKYSKNDFSSLIFTCDDSEFLDFLSKNETYLPDSIITYEDIKREFNNYLIPNLEIVYKAIERYKKEYGEFPFDEAAYAIVNGREYSALKSREYELASDVFLNYAKQIAQQWDDDHKFYQNEIDKYNDAVEEWNGMSGFSQNFTAFSMILSSHNALTENQINSLGKELQKDSNGYLKLLNDNIDKFLLDTYVYSVYLNEFNTIGRSVGALNWLLTAIEGYDEPDGSFFADLYDTSSEWIKSPSIVLSSNDGMSYGGHNLDASVSRVIVDNTIAKGSYKIVKSGGKNVIYTSSTNVKDITPSVLRSIERRALSGTQKLTQEASPIRSVECIDAPTIHDPIAIGSTDKQKSNSPYLASYSERLQRSITANGKDYNSLDAVFTDIVSGKLDGKELRFVNYSENEIRVFLDDANSCIMQRNRDYNIDLNSYDFEGMVSTEKHGNAEITKIKIPETTPIYGKESFLEFEVPTKQKSNYINALKRLFSKPAKKINNIFKWKNELKKDLDRIEQIKIDNIYFEQIIYSVIIHKDGNISILQA